MKSIIVSVNDSLSSWMNDAALDDFVRDFNESASEIWEKRFRNSLKCSSVNEWLSMMRFVWKRKIEQVMMLNDWRRKMYRVMFNLQQRRWDLFVDLIDSLANNEDSLSLNLSIDLILEQFTKILYHDSLNWVEQLIFTRLLHKNELILLIKWTLHT